VVTLTHLWVIPMLPAAGAAVTGLLGVRWFGRTLSALVACVALGGAFILSLYVLAGLMAVPPAQRVYDVVLGDWIPEIPLATVKEIGMFRIPWSLTADALSAVMLIVVTGVGLLIHVYAAAYMKDEPSAAYARFFSCLNLFCAFMLVLVLAGNFIVLFAGWEGVGLCSYLLIGFWYRKESAASAGKKAFIVNRIGDTGLFVGILLVFFTFGTLDFREVAAAAAGLPVETARLGVLSAICLLLCAGAVGKSAQLPLFVWLPEAMEGPTPVSALIHAATMVTAGVYLIARNAVLFEHAPLVMGWVSAIGAITALMAAAVACVQDDIKRVLAYSTISQLGFMFLAAGAGACGAAIFHLTTHAIFKALLFLCSGAVIHALAGEQDLRKMGGLRRQMPITFITMGVGALALAGFPPLAGFFSKDAILYGALGVNPILFSVAIATSLLTAFYVSRLMALAWFGSYRGPAALSAASSPATHAAAIHGVLHPHDGLAHGEAEREAHEVTHGPTAPPVERLAHGAVEPRDASWWMTMPLVVLAGGTAVAGWLGVPETLGGADRLIRFLSPVFSATAMHGPAGSRQSGSGVVIVVGVAIASAGLMLARYFYVTNPAAPSRMASRWPRLYAVLSNEFHVDALYRVTFVRGTLAMARRLSAADSAVIDGGVEGVGAAARIGAWLAHMTDKYIVDGGVNGVGRGAWRSSFFARTMQTGLVQNYALMMVFGLFVFLTLYLLAG
jgi:NADH-quinone oxidoreductase subunit L